MKIEKLRNKNSKKYFLCGLICVVVLTITVTFIGSKANYRMTASIPLTEGKVTASPYDINIVALYLDGVEQSKDTLIPSGYKINEDESYCYKGSRSNIDSNARAFTDELGNHVFSGISKSSKCLLYLDKITSNAKTMGELLESHYIAKSIRNSETKEFNIPLSGNTYGAIYKTLDDYGTSYYFAGNPLDNWIEFGGYYWRIIRINGDGSIRMIYQGRTEDENGNKLKPQIIGPETIIGRSKFNEQDNDNAYVGFMYGTPNSSSYEETHENKNSSTIKKALDNWFASSNIKKGSTYFEKIDKNAGFCGDRQSSSNPSTIDGKSGTGASITYYGTMVRVVPGRSPVSSTSTMVNPSLSCANNNDLYTYTEANRGNKKLNYPVGLITADEVAFAGSGYGYGASISYLRTGMDFWTISPFHAFSQGFGNAGVFYLAGGHMFYTKNVTDEADIRPVINIRSDVTFTGDGTQSNPFKVVVS